MPHANGAAIDVDDASRIQREGPARIATGPPPRTPRYLGHMSMSRQRSYPALSRLRCVTSQGRSRHQVRIGADRAKARIRAALQPRRRSSSRDQPSTHGPVRTLPKALARQRCTGLIASIPDGAAMATEIRTRPMSPNRGEGRVELTERTCNVGARAHIASVANRAGDAVDVGRHRHRTERAKRFSPQALRRRALRAAPRRHRHHRARKPNFPRS